YRLVVDRMRVSKKTEKFLYVYSSDVHQNVEIRIGSLDGIFRDALDPTRVPGPMIVEVTVYSHGRSIGCPVSTSFACSTSSRNHIQTWDEWLTLPVKYSDLSRDSFLHFTMWDQVDELTLPSEFAEKCKRERKRAPSSPLVVLDDSDEEWEEWEGPASSLHPSPSSSIFPRRLVAECSFSFFCPKSIFRTGVIDLQLEMVDRPNPCRIPYEPWRFGGDAEDTDRLIREYDNRMKEMESESTWLTKFTAVAMEQLKDTRKRSQRGLFLVIRMAEALMEHEAKYDIIHYEKPVAITHRRFVGEGDNELGMENPCETKYTTTMRQISPADRQLKPNTKGRQTIEAILELPPSKSMTAEQANLIWKYRYFLSTNNRALTKFLHSVNWDSKGEMENALQMMDEWRPIRPEDALELLSPQFRHPKVRAYAVNRLVTAAPDRLQLFLPQLVQALKYEPQTVTIDIDAARVEASISEDAPDMVEVNETKTGTDDLASFLIQYSTSYLNFANSLFWHLKVEEQALMGQEHGAMYSSLRKQLVAALETSSNAEVRARAKSVVEQEEFVEILKKETQRAQKNVETLRENLKNNAKLQKLDGLPLPIDPNFKMQQVISNSAMFFNSAMTPCKLTLSGQRNSSERVADTFTVIFKKGDDLRQDQLVMQMIRLMDSLLRENELDLKMTPYAVLATGIDEGFVQFIKAMPLRDVVNKHTSIHSAMKTYRPSPKDLSHFGIEPEVIDNYVRSLAGYSIVCYILGVGDRHLDNLLLCENGKLFHVDFGFILGRDPKPLPPPMKLTSEMIAAMGGQNSDQWKRFVSFCDQAFQILRRHANLILNLFSLMLDAGIPDIALERDKAVAKVETRLQLHLSDDDRYSFVNRLIESSASSKMGFVSDFMHDLKQNIF
ncbi:hypothetical protein PFISCL1PPCAC_19493, partial [Pristionchus fissidentatus]